MNPDDAKKLLDHLLSLPKETEWLEFKDNNYNPEELGQYISALSNAACLHHQTRAYIVFGIEDQTRKIIGTEFDPKSLMVGTQELINWLDTQLHPNIVFKFHEPLFETGNKVIILEIQPAIGFPVLFKSEAYIRIGSYKKKLKDHQGSEKLLWETLNKTDFESIAAVENINPNKVLELIDYPSVFELLEIPLPPDKENIIKKLEEEKIIYRRGDLCDITNLGALLFSKKIELFDLISRKAVRVIVYKGKDRTEAISELIGIKGYASGFEGLIDYINSQIPSNELIGQALRTNTKMYPDIAIRELTANALIHQDLTIKGSGPIIEIFSDRIEFSNPGKPLIDILRFLDHTPRSRNEKLARIMRRVRVCEERGSGIDKVIHYAELFQLPAPNFEVGDEFTRATLYAHKTWADMEKKDKIRAAYQHASLKFISNEIMTNISFRKRLNIADSNYPIASRIITEAIESGLIKPFDTESKSRKFAKYVPFWA